MKHKLQKLKSGLYIYRGITIRKAGYFHPERRVVWEAHDNDQSALAHGFSLSEVKKHIDDLLEEV